MSVTAPRLPLPALCVITTVAPPVVSALPFASFAVTVNVDVETPLAVMEYDEAAIDDCAADTAPGWVVSVAEVPVNDEPSVAVMVPDRADTVGVV